MIDQYDLYAYMRKMKYSQGYIHVIEQLIDEYIEYEFRERRG